MEATTLTISKEEIKDIIKIIISRTNNLPNIKDEAYLINLGECKSIGNQWMALYASGDNRRISHNLTYFFRFVVEYISKEFCKFISNKSITTNIDIIQTFNPINCEYFCVGFIDLMTKDKGLLNYTNLFSSN